MTTFGRLTMGASQVNYSMIGVLLALATIPGCDEPIAEVPAGVGDELIAIEKRDGCRVSGQIVSSAWRARGGGIERSIVSVWALPNKGRVEETSAAGEDFEVRLPPGRYRIVCSAVGTRGATFETVACEINVAERQERHAVGQVDLPLSKTTHLYGQPAPELDGISAWQDTPPVTLKDLRGRVVVLDFFGYYCTICHTHKRDLVQLRDKYANRGLVVVTIHDASLKTLDEVNAKMQPVIETLFEGHRPNLAMALDGSEQRGVFQAYGIQAVPAVILIDPEGRVVRRYHHAGKPELETDIQALLKTLR